MSEYDEIVERARADDVVLGLILTGSRKRSFRVGPDADHDVRLVLRDDALDTYLTPHGSRVEVVAMTRSAFERVGLPGSGSDKLDGETARLVAVNARLNDAEARTLAASALDDYVNSYYCSARNHQNDLPFEARLDAAESVGPLLTTLFAVRQRVRPFNKFLGWELRLEPLGGEEWAADTLLARLQKIVGSGDLAEQQAVFRDVERLEREHGLGDVIDGWEADVAWLRCAS